MKSPFVGAIFAIALNTSAVAAATEWPQFRGPTGQGLSSAVQVPLQWDEKTNVAWKIAVPGRGWSSPVLSDGKIYLTSAVSDAGSSELTLHALCFDAGDGRQLWDVEIIRPDPAGVAAMHRKNSPASPTPILADGKLYVHFGHMGSAALDLSGKVLWKQTEVKYPPVHGGGGSPVLSGGVLVFSADGGEASFLAGLDAATGAIRWKTPRNSPAKKQFSFSTPLAIDLDGKTQIISPTSGFVGAYTPADGKELWRVGYGEGYSVVPRPVFANGLLYVSSGFDQPVLHAIQPTGAAGDATETNVEWKLKKGAPCTPSMLVVGDELYMVSDAGIATCADARTGNVHWTERLGGDFSASPVAAEGRIYFQNEVGVGYVVKAAPKFELLSKNPLNERSLASYAVADGALFIRTEAHLWKIAATTAAP